VGYHWQSDYQHLRPQVKLAHHWYGNDYGGFYACPNLLGPDSIIYSVGIGQDISFDRAIIAAHACRVWGFDPTPKSAQWLESQSLPPQFSFLPLGLGVANETQTFYLPADPRHVSGSFVNQSFVSTQHATQVPMRTLATLMQELGHSKIDLLKIDIEGLEYNLIEHLALHPQPIGQLCIEFHDRFFPEDPFRSKTAVKTLAAMGYLPFAVSETFEEVSFVHESVVGRA
jgi:FkbM family methyltransferase